MTGTGFSHERAAPHERAVALVLAEMWRRGYQAREEPVDGHRPDIKFRDNYPGAHQGRLCYIDVKTGGPNLAVEVDSFQCYLGLELTERRVYIVHCQGEHPQRWQVHTPDSIRIKRGPHRRSGSGSQDDWYLCDPAGTPFSDFFPSVIAMATHGTPTLGAIRRAQASGS